MYPYGTSAYNLDETLDIYVKQSQPLNLTPGVPSTTVNVDSYTYQSYSNGGSFASAYGLPAATAQEQQQLTTLKSQLDSLSSQISALTVQTGSGLTDTINQSNANTSGLSTGSSQITNTNQQVTAQTNPPLPSGTVTDADATSNANAIAGQESFTVSNNDISGIQRIVQESDIVVLQKNFEYLFWSILAAGTVIVAMNIAKK